jgi:hypothetical protein
MCPLSVVAPEFLRIRKTPVRHSIEEMQRLAEVRGGSCLSAAFRTLHHKLQWRCRQGHTWSAIAGNVLRGSWCRYCAHRVQRSIDEMRQIAISRGGQCLSSEYQNLRTTLEWRCAAGHIWTAPAGAIAAGKWCMQCSLVEKYSIEEIHQLAIERAGRCKSPTTLICARGSSGSVPKDIAGGPQRLRFWAEHGVLFAPGASDLRWRRCRESENAFLSRMSTTTRRYCGLAAKGTNGWRFRAMSGRRGRSVEPGARNAPH